MTYIASPPRHAVEMRAFGPLDLRTAEGEELRSALAQGKRMALLCYLAIASPRGFHRRDTLVGLFWSEVDQQRARAALRQALHFLRQSVGHDIVETRGPEEIGLNCANFTCDVLQFEDHIENGRLESAVQLYRGPLLNGHFVTDAPEFERWLGNERDRLSRAYADALKSLATTASDTGCLAEAVLWWRRLSIHDPYSAEVACKLMSALDAAGDRAAAIAHAHNHAEAVRTELELEPEPEVLNVAADLKNRPSLPHVRQPTWANVADQERHDPALENTATMPAEDLYARRRRLVLRVLAPVLFLAALAYAFLAGRNATSDAPSTALAVLPFENLGSAIDDYFVDGLADDIVNRLAGLHGLSIIGPNRGELSSPGESDSVAGGGTSAAFLLRATVERTPRETGQAVVRVIPSLIRVADGSQLWTETVEHEISSVFAGQIRIAEEITRLLEIQPLSTEREWLQATPTADIDAYDMFLRGENHLRRAPGSLADARLAVELFAGAAERDTTFVQAYAKLAIAHTSMYWWNHDRSTQRLASARTAADHAIRLRADMPVALLALGWYYYWGERDYDRALRHFELARTNWPGLSEVLVLVAGIRRRQGDFERSLENHHDAAAADPYCTECFVGSAFTHLIMRNYDEAARDIARAEAVAPTLAYTRYVDALTRLSGQGDIPGARRVIQAVVGDQQLIQLAAGRWEAIPRILGSFDDRISVMQLGSDIIDTVGYYLVKGELASRTTSPQASIVYYDSARTMLEVLVAGRPDDPQLRSRLGLAYAGLGRNNDALREGTEAVRLRPLSEDAVDGADALTALARIHTLLGDYDAAVDRLEALLAAPSIMSTELLRLDPVWDHLRQNPRFLRLVQ